MEIGEKIKARRKELSMTAKRLAEISGLHSSTIIRYESGQTKKIPVAVMERISKALGVDEAYFKADKEAGKVLVPLLGRVAAGLGYLADNVIESYISVDKEEITNASDYIYLKVKGDSMYPIFLENDLVLVKVCDSIENGSYGVFIIDGEDGVIKKVVYGNDYVELLSVNPLYPPRRFEGKDVLRVRVFGEVKEITRKF